MIVPRAVLDCRGSRQGADLQKGDTVTTRTEREAFDLAYAMLTPEERAEEWARQHPSEALVASTGDFVRDYIEEAWQEQWAAEGSDPSAYGDGLRNFTEAVVHHAAPRRFLVEQPYRDMGDEPVLELDPISAERTELSWRRQLSAIVGRLDEMPEYHADEVERILRGAVLLFAAEAGTLGQCLDTAMIWERG